MADEKMKAALKQIYERAKEVPARTGRAGIAIPKDVAEALYKRAKESDFILDVATLNDLCGFKSKNLRDRTIMAKLNEQHADVLTDDEQFFIGSATVESVRHYKIKIITPEE